jgi:hypothetical protein
MRRELANARGLPPALLPANRKGLQTPIIAVAVLLILIGVFAFVAVLLRFV